jgi:hypothetical protein
LSPSASPHRSVIGGFHVGRVYESAGNLDVALKQADKVIEVERVVTVEVPKIVTKVVTKEKVIEKEVDRVIAQVPHLLDPDCVLPGDFGLLLVAAANGLDPAAPGSVDAIAGGYDCREVITAILTDLRAGWRNSARLEGLQSWAKLVTERTP